MECSSKEWIGVEDIFDQAIVDAVRVGEEVEARMKGLETIEENGTGRSSGQSKGSKGSKRRRGGKGCRIL